MGHPGYPRWLAWPAVLYLVVFSVVPTGVVVAYSVLRRDYYGQVVNEFSADGWREATDGLSLTVLGRSVAIAGGVTAVCLLLGYPSAMALAGLPARWRRACLLLVSFPLVTSLLLRMYGWVNLLPLGWRGTPWAVGLVMSVNYLPFMLLPLLRSWERLDADLTRAALDLGATPWQTFRHVTWPLTRPGMWAGCALVFIPASGEYLVPHFIGEGKVLVLGNLIVEQFLEHRNWPFGAALAVWLLGLVALPAAVAAASRAGPTRLPPERRPGDDHA